MNQFGGISGITNTNMMHFSLSGPSKKPIRLFVVLSRKHQEHQNPQEAHASHENKNWIPQCIVYTSARTHTRSPQQLLICVCVYFKTLQEDERVKFTFNLTAILPQQQQRLTLACFLLFDRSLVACAYWEFPSAERGARRGAVNFSTWALVGVWDSFISLRHKRSHPNLSKTNYPALYSKMCDFTGSARILLRARACDVRARSFASYSKSCRVVGWAAQDRLSAVACEDFPLDACEFAICERAPAPCGEMRCVSSKCAQRKRFHTHHADLSLCGCNVR